MGCIECGTENLGRNARYGSMLNCCNKLGVSCGSADDWTKKLRIESQRNGIVRYVAA
jgi:hypothetical protein